LPEAHIRPAEHYREFGPIVFRYCVAMLKDREAARDATQDVFLKLVRNVSRFEDRAAVIPWLLRVARNHCLNLRRDSQRWCKDKHDGDVARGVAAEASLDRYAARALVQDVLSRFDFATRVVAVGVIVGGMRHEEVAVALGVSLRAVARKLERFLTRARAYVTTDEDDPTAAERKQAALVMSSRPGRSRRSRRQHTAEQ
jgi:RNA polymerase sigma-70 factor, ECF subfamily